MTKQNWIATLKLICIVILTVMLVSPFVFAGEIYSCWLRDSMVFAARAGDNRQLSVLMMFGADPSPVGWEEHVTPLGGATQCGRAATVRFLLKHGADFRRTDDHRQTALEIARDCGQSDIATILEKAGAAR